MVCDMIEYGGMHMDIQPKFWRDKEYEDLSAYIDQVFTELLIPAAMSDVVCDYKKILSSLYELGLSGLRYQENKGGVGKGLAAQALFAEGLGIVPSGGIGMALTIHLDMVAPFVDQYGTDQQITEFLVPALKGDILFSHAVSEPEAGSDISNIHTTAIQEGDGWRVQGKKSMISLASLADVHFVVAQLPEFRPPFNMVNFLIPADTPGLRVSPTYPTLGNHHCPIANIELDDVYLDDSFRVGPVGMGMINQMQQFSQERILSSLRANRVARRCLDDVMQSTDKAEEKWVSLNAQWAASRSVTYRAMQAWIEGEEYLTLSCASKLLSSRLARQASWLSLNSAKAMQPSLICDNLNQVYDARLYSISTGSDEMMLKTIAAAEKY